MACPATWMARALPMPWSPPDATPAQMTWQAGIDVLSLGGTKNGCMGVEAVVLFDPARAFEFELRRKRAGTSSGPNTASSPPRWRPGWTDDLWLRLAAQANAMGQNLVQALAPGHRISSLIHPAPGQYASSPGLRPGAPMQAPHERGAQFYTMDAGSPDHETARFVASVVHHPGAEVADADHRACSP